MRFARTSQGGPPPLSLSAPPEPRASVGHEPSMLSPPFGSSGAEPAAPGGAAPSPRHAAWRARGLSPHGLRAAPRAPSGSADRMPKSADEARFPIRSPFAAEFPTLPPPPPPVDSAASSPASGAPAPGAGRYTPTLRRPRRGDDDADATRVMLHGAAAGAHAAGDHRTQLLVHNLPPHVRWQDLKDLFRRAGTVLRADVHMPADTHAPQAATGTVLFATEDDALRARDTLHGYTWHGRVLDVALDHQLTVDLDRAQPPARHGTPPTHARAEAPAYMPPPALPRHGAAPPVPPALPFPGRVLFVGNVPFQCQWQDLKDLFRAAGNIQRADVALNADGRSRGFGTVLFASPEDAQTAVRLYHGYEYCGRALKVHFDRHALYGPPTAGIPTDPSQYTAAFQTQAPASAARAPNVLGAPSAAPPLLGAPPGAPARFGAPEDGWPAPLNESLLARPDAHPGRISLPPLTFPGLGGSVGLPDTPGMVSYLTPTMIESSTVYPYMLSPGLAYPTPTLVPGMTPYHSMGPMPGAGAPAGAHALPPTPHWSQPPPLRAPDAQHQHQPLALDTPVAAPATDALAPVGTRLAGGYPFPATHTAAAAPDADADADADTDTDAAAPATTTASHAHTAEQAAREKLAALSLGGEQTTRDLTEAIAKLSVRGTARTKRRAAPRQAGEHGGASTPTTPTAPEEA